LPLSVNVDLTNHKLVFKGGGVTLTGDLTPPYAASGLTFYSTDAKTKLTGTGAAAKRYATGIVALSSSEDRYAHYYQTDGNYGSGNMYSLSISNLGFVPKTILVLGGSYNAIIVYRQSMSALGHSDCNILETFTPNTMRAITTNSAIITENSIVLPIFAGVANSNHTFFAYE